jgi:hypothetical protein
MSKVVEKEKVLKAFLKAMTYYQMTNNHASDTCYRKMATMGQLFLLKLHICPYLIYGIMHSIMHVPVTIPRICRFFISELSIPHPRAYKEKPIPHSGDRGVNYSENLRTLHQKSQKIFGKIPKSY